MIRRGNIQNDKAKTPGYVGRTLHRTSVLMLINAQGDKVLFSSDMGNNYTEKDTATGSPYSLNIINSHPSSIASGDSRILACNTKRTSTYAQPGANASAVISYSTKFTDENGIQSKLYLPGNTGFTGNSAFIAKDGIRKIIFARAKFEDWDDFRFTFLYYKNGVWYRSSTQWTGVDDFDASVSDDLRVIVSVGHKSLDYGETVTPLNPGAGYTIVRVALSGTGDVLYAIREKKWDSRYICEAWLSVSYDYGETWINVQNLLPMNPNTGSASRRFELGGEYTTRRGTSIATNENGDCVAFIYNDTHLGWSPNRGAYLYTKTLNYDLPYNQIAMDRSGYYLCITNTNIVMPTDYYQNGELSAVYTMNMHTLQASEPNINTGFDKCIATAILR